jgi:hypothetical protein
VPGRARPERAGRGERQRAWIFTVARNLAIDSYRASAARRAAEAAMRHHAATQRTTVAGPHLHAELRERLALLDAAIRSLPEDLRVTLAMATAIPVPALAALQWSSAARGARPRRGQPHGCRRSEPGG